MPVEAKVLIGWMEHDAAVRFLTESCHNDVPLTPDAAVAIWLPFRDRVAALPERPRQEPTRVKLTKPESKHAKAFLKQVKKFNRDVSAVIKVDLMDLAVHQLFVLTERSANYSAAVCDWAGWRKNCLRPRPKVGLTIPTRREQPNIVVFEIPHAEFVLGAEQTPSGPKVTIHENPKWVTVTPHDGRLVLWAGYHRSHARMAGDDPAMGDRAVPVVLVRNLVGPANTAAVTAATGLRPALFRDFFDEDFFITVRLRRKRYELRATFNGDQVSVSRTELSAD